MTSQSGHIESLEVQKENTRESLSFQSHALLKATLDRENALAHINEMKKLNSKQVERIHSLEVKSQQLLASKEHLEKLIVKSNSKVEKVEASLVSSLRANVAMNKTLEDYLLQIQIFKDKMEKAKHADFIKKTALGGATKMIDMLFATVRLHEDEIEKLKKNVTHSVNEIDQAKYSALFKQCQIELREAEEMKNEASKTIMDYNRRSIGWKAQLDAKEYEKGLAEAAKMHSNMLVGKLTSDVQEYKELGKSDTTLSC